MRGIGSRPLLRAGRLWLARELRVAVWRASWLGRSEPLLVSVTELGGQQVELRRGSSDARVLWDTFYGRYHLPPPELAADEARLIVDLGANVGLTAGHLASLYPGSKVLAVEPDPGNARLCRRNLKPWSDRCTVVEAAVWTTDGAVSFETQAGAEWAARVEPGGSSRARAVTLDTLLDGERVDFMKVDVEGAERELLRAGGRWTAQVDLLKVEVHPPYSVDECMADLERLGFRPTRDARHWACVLGRRRS